MGHEPLFGLVFQTHVWDRGKQAESYWIPESYVDAPVTHCGSGIHEQ